jgi:hypothetical protein
VYFVVPGAVEAREVLGDEEQGVFRISAGHARPPIIVAVKVLFRISENTIVGRNDDHTV